MILPAVLNGPASTEAQAKLHQSDYRIWRTGHSGVHGVENGRTPSGALYLSAMKLQQPSKMQNRASRSIKVDAAILPLARLQVSHRKE